MKDSKNIDVIKLIYAEGFTDYSLGKEFKASWNNSEAKQTSLILENSIPISKIEELIEEYEKFNGNLPHKMLNDLQKLIDKAKQ